MSYRFMRMLVFFDLPVDTSEDKREYRKFRKFLINNGFIMMQESVYVKLLLNGTAENSMIDLIRKNRPRSGIVQALSVTEKQFSRMEFITGSFSSDILSSDERLVIY